MTALPGWLLLLFGAVVLISVPLGFSIGLRGWMFVDKTKTGVGFGLASAVAWGLGSIGGGAALSNPSNAFAAWFAAVSLGYLTPVDAVCAPFSDGTLFFPICHLSQLWG